MAQRMCGAWEKGRGEHADSLIHILITQQFSSAVVTVMFSISSVKLPLFLRFPCPVLSDWQESHGRLARGLTLICMGGTERGCVALQYPSHMGPSEQAQAVCALGLSHSQQNLTQKVLYSTFSPEPLGHCCAISLLLARHDHPLARMEFPLCLPRP